MGFPPSLLADHEKLVFDLRPHWLAMFSPGLWTVGLLIGLFIGYRAVDAVITGNASIGKSIVGGIALIAWIALAVIPFLKWRFTMFVLTTDRLITRTGIIAKQSKEIPLERVNDISFNQSIVERMVGAGDLVIESAGELGQNRITNVRKPDQVQLAIFNEIESNNA